MTTRTAGATAPPSNHSASSTRKFRLVLRVLLLVCAAGSAGVLGSTETLAQNAYITHVALDLSGAVSVIDTVIATVPVGSEPEAVGASPDGTRIYVANSSDNTVSMAARATV
jgi:YVTN family beta-propeller protein